MEVQLKEETAAQTVLGFPALATKNTTRVGGEDPLADAAGAASAVYPGKTRGTRPQAVTLVDKGDWRAGIAAAALMAPPLRAPILLTDGGDLPDATSTALDTLAPTGARAAGGAQAIEVGDARAPDELRSRRVTGDDPFELAAAIDALMTDVRETSLPERRHRVRGRPSIRDARRGVGGEVGRRGAVRQAGSAAERHPHGAQARTSDPASTCSDPRAPISRAVEGSLRKLGQVKRVSGRTPVDNAIAFARYSDGSFGWGVRDPGHGLVFANSDRPLDAAAGAALSASGKYGPLLLLDNSDPLPRRLESYLLDIQPGYRFDPVRGVYNHAWLMGDESAISVDVQARIDELLEIVRVRDEEL